MKRQRIVILAEFFFAYFYPPILFKELLTESYPWVISVWLKCLFLQYILGDLKVPLFFATPTIPWYTNTIMHNAQLCCCYIVLCVFKLYRMIHTYNIQHYKQERRKICELVHIIRKAYSRFAVEILLLG